jgi:hypothetical protein
MEAIVTVNNGGDSNIGQCSVKEIDRKEVIKPSYAYLSITWQILAYATSIRWYLDYYELTTTTYPDEAIGGDVVVSTTTTSVEKSIYQDNPLTIEKNELDYYINPENGQSAGLDKYAYNFVFSPKKFTINAGVRSYPHTPGDVNPDYDNMAIDWMITPSMAAARINGHTLEVNKEDDYTTYIPYELSCEYIEGDDFVVTAAAEVYGINGTKYRVVEIVVMDGTFASNTRFPLKKPLSFSENNVASVTLSVDAIIKQFINLEQSVSWNGSGRYLGLRVGVLIRYKAEPTNLIMRLEGKWYTSGRILRSKASGTIIRDA